MFAYDSKSQKFFSSKFFGAHINAAAAMDEGGMGAYGEDWAFYLENLLGPVAAPAKRLLDRIGITVVEENKVPEGVTTAFEKECVPWFSNVFCMISLLLRMDDACPKTIASVTLAFVSDRCSRPPCPLRGAAPRDATGWWGSPGWRRAGW